MKLRRHNSLIGISVEPDRVAICRLRRQGKSAELLESFNAPIPTPAFRDDPVQAGHELRRHLQASGIRGSRCAVCVPLSWAITSELDLPDLSETDMDSLAELEAQKRFPLPPDELRLAVARNRDGHVPRRGLLVGVPAEHLSNVETVLKAARLHPVSITFGMAALAQEAPEPHCLLVHVGQGVVDLAIVCDGAITTLRNLLWQVDSSATDAHARIREIAQQIRITLGQLSQEQRGLLRTAVLYFDDGWPEEALASFQDALSRMGLNIVLGSHSAWDQAPQTCLALAACAKHTLLGLPAVVDLAVKRTARLQSAAARLSARWFRWVVGVPTVLVMCLASAFVWQDRRLARLERAWDEAAPRVQEAQAIQDNVRKYRSWYDDSIPSLAAPKHLASSFPEEGVVWLKSLQVKDRTMATCSGSARTREDWMRVMSKLGKNRDINDLKVVQARGSGPFTFTVTFRCSDPRSEPRP